LLAGNNPRMAQQLLQKKLEMEAKNGDTGAVVTRGITRDVRRAGTAGTLTTEDANGNAITGTVATAKSGRQTVAEVGKNLSPTLKAKRDAIERDAITDLQSK
jgi:hypothetical protein